jgi:hypothetical protein
MMKDGKLHDDEERDKMESEHIWWKWKNVEKMKWTAYEITKFIKA